MCLLQVQLAQVRFFDEFHVTAQFEGPMSSYSNDHPLV